MFRNVLSQRIHAGVARGERERVCSLFDIVRKTAQLNPYRTALKTVRDRPAHRSGARIETREFIFLCDGFSHRRGERCNGTWVYGSLRSHSHPIGDDDDDRRFQS